MKHVKRILLGALLAVCILYLLDDVSVRYGIPKGRDPFGSVLVRRYYAVPQKNGRVEFYFDQPETQRCVHSLFPHFGYSPCWYLNRHKQKRIDE